MGQGSEIIKVNKQCHEVPFPILTHVAGFTPLPAYPALHLLDEKTRSTVPRNVYLGNQLEYALIYARLEPTKSGACYCQEAMLSACHY